MPHIHDKIDFTVEVFVVYKDKVLLRVHDKFKIWLSVGGHVELDEDPVQAGLREVKEEVGLDVEIVGNLEPEPDHDFIPLITPRYLGRHKYSDTHDHVTFIYFAKANADTILESQSAHEKAETKWVSREELSTMDLKPNILFYATKALEELGEK